MEKAKFDFNSEEQKEKVLKRLKRYSEIRETVSKRIEEISASS